MAIDALEFAGHELSRASLDQCVKCTICEAHCPVLEVTNLFSGPKYVGPQAERYRHDKSVDHSLDYCSSCGTCTLVCPQGVKIAELNSQARAIMKQKHMPLRDRIITQTNLMGAVMSPFAPIANAVLAMKSARLVIEKIIGIHRNAPMPTARFITLSHWLRTRKRTAPAPTKGALVFFHGCAGGYFEVETSKKTIEILEHLGYEVIVPKQTCCGLAQQSNGLYDGATKHVLKLCDQLIAAGKDLTIISSSGSCTGMLKHEAHEIMGIDDPRLRDVGTRIREFSEFLLELHEAGEFPADKLRSIDATLPYHAPCQLKGQQMGMPAIDMMELIPGLTIKESGRACCGIAGTYGLKAEKFEVAQAVGKPLFDMVRATSKRLAICDTETCRWQIEKGSGVKTVHPAAVMHYALGLSDDLFE